jgi:hypothetical protein
MTYLSLLIKVSSNDSESCSTAKVGYRFKGDLEFGINLKNKLISLEQVDLRNFKDKVDIFTGRLV